MYKPVRQSQEGSIQLLSVHTLRSAGFNFKEVEKMLKEIVEDMMRRSEKESWQTKEETWYRINIMRNGYGFPRMLQAQSEEHPHGLTESKVAAMVKKGDTLHKITVTIERLK